MIKQTALAMVLASAMAHKATHPFKIGDEVIDFEEIPSLPDPVSYEVEMKKDQQTIAEMKGELESAAKNVDKGSLNREMSSALIQDIKSKFTELDQHFSK